MVVIARELVNIYRYVEDWGELRLDIVQWVQWIYSNIP